MVIIVGFISNHPLFEIDSVGLTTGETTTAGHLFDRLVATDRPCGSQLIDLVSEREVQFRLKLLTLVTGDQEDHLSTGRLGVVPVAQFGEGAASKLLVELGQLAGEHRRPVAENFERIVEGLANPVRGLVKNESWTHFSQLFETGPPGHFAGRQKADEEERVGRKPPGDQRGDESRRAGNGNDANVGGKRGLDEPVGRIGDPGSPGIADQGDRRAAAQPLDQFVGARPLVMLVIADRRRGNAEMVEEQSGVGVSSQAISDDSLRTRSARIVMSSRFPIGVATR